MRERIAQMWTCGDSNCDCRQPQIVERSTEHWREPTWRTTCIVEEGPFRTSPLDEEWQEQVDWLLAKAREYNVANLVQILSTDWTLREELV
jgi:hypothetical protein